MNSGLGLLVHRTEEQLLPSDKASNAPEIHPTVQHSENSQGCDGPPERLTQKHQGEGSLALGHQSVALILVYIDV